MINFTVLGLPVAKGRPRFSGKGFAYTPKKTKEAEDNFLSQAFKYRPEKPFDCPLVIRMRIYKPKPKSKSKKVVHWTTRPDLDNFIKILDALNGVFWLDDSQIIRIDATKQYGEPARTELEIWDIHEGESNGDSSIHKERESGNCGTS